MRKVYLGNYIKIFHLKYKLFSLTNYMKQIKSKSSRSTKKKVTKKSNRNYSKRNYVSYRIEKKHLDKVNNASITNLGNLFVLTDVTTIGSGDTQRIGDQIYGLYIFLKLKLSLTTGASFDNVRVIIFRDTMGVNAPIVSDVLEGGQLGGGFAPLAQYNHYNISRYQFMYDKIHRISLGNGESNIVSRTIPIYKKIEFIGASTFKNQIYMILVSDESNILTLPSAAYTTRLFYTDI